MAAEGLTGTKKPPIRWGLLFFRMMFVSAGSPTARNVEFVPL